jgi:phosphoenolpyruvate-protein kinase (PTS system EI component)
MRSIAFPVELPSALFERYDLEAFDDLQALKAELGPRFGDSQAAIMRALYYMAGDPIFESRLHAAVRRLANEFEEVIAARAYGRTSVSLGKMEERDDDRARLEDLASVDATAPPEVIDEEEPI